MGEEKSDGISLKLLVFLGAVFVAMALFIAIAVVCVSLATQLKADTAAVQSAYLAEKNRGPDHTHPLQDHTHPPQRPPLVAFSVATRREFKQKDKRVPMEEILYNDGNYFRSDNAFYAPYKGVYAFTFGSIAAANREVKLNLCKKRGGSNEENVAAAMSKAVATNTATSNDYASASGRVILQLDKGEQVYVKQKSNDGFLKSDKPTPPSTYFTGELKQKLN